MDPIKNPPSVDSVFGAFLVSFEAEVPANDAVAAVPAFASVLGRLTDAEEPAAVNWVLSDEQAGCKLLVPRLPFCDPTCSGGRVCTSTGASDTCVQFPKAQSAGTVQVSGLGPDPFSMTYVAGNYQSATLPYPPCVEGDMVRLSADGGTHAPFTLEARCIAPLTFSGPVAIEMGRGLDLRWSAPGRTDLGRIQVKLDISHHGGTKGKIECDVADTGALHVEAALVDALVGLGVAGFPTISVARVVRSSAGASNHVALLISDSSEQAVEIPGVVSCLEDEDCNGKGRCQSDRQCR